MLTSILISESAASINRECYVPPQCGTRRATQVGGPARMLRAVIALIVDRCRRSHIFAVWAA